MTDTLERAADARTCANCGTTAIGDFCHACGQRLGVHRLTLPHLLHEIPHAVFHVDRGILVTLRALATRPGPTINGYLDGHRVRYFNPLSLLMLLAGLCALIYTKFPFDYSGFAVGVRPDQARIMIEVQRTMLVNYSLGLIVQLPFLALASRWLLGGGRSYGEHLVVNAFILSFMCAVNLLLMPAYMLGNGTQWIPRIMMWSVLIFLAYQIYALWSTFRTPGKGAVTALRTIGAVAVFYAMIVAIALMIGMAYGIHAAMRGH